MSTNGLMDKYLDTVMTIESNNWYIDQPYEMLEDGGHWLWSDDMIARLELDKVEVHQDFYKWYGNIKTKNPLGYKFYSISLISSLNGWHTIEEDSNGGLYHLYPELDEEMMENKEKYIRAILDGNWVVRELKIGDV
jgi:hypothetical protein